MCSKFFRIIEKITISLIWLLCFSNFLQATYEEDLYEYGEAVRRNLKFEHFQDGYQQGQYIAMCWSSAEHNWVESKEPRSSYLVYNHPSCQTCQKFTALQSSREWAEVRKKLQREPSQLMSISLRRNNERECVFRRNIEGESVTELDIVLARNYQQMLADGHGCRTKYGPIPEPVCSNCRSRKDQVPFQSVCLASKDNCGVSLIRSLYKSWDTTFRKFMDDKMVLYPQDIELWEIKYPRFSRMARELESTKSL